jgi:mRNA interferase MazF
VERPAVGTVVALEVPYPDATGFKKRPALILAHANEEECFLLEITSQPLPRPATTPLDAADFASGGLRRKSYVRGDRLFTAHISLFTSIAGTLKPEAFWNILQKTLSLFPVKQGNA